MKKSVAEFLKANGFYLSFGVGVVALVVALAVYNVNTNKKQQQGQEINLNEPLENQMADAEVTEEVQETILDGDMDVPKDTWNTEDVAKEDKTSVEDETSSEMEVAQNTESQDIDSQDTESQDTEIPSAEEAMSNQTMAFAPLDGLSFEGMEAVSMPVLGNTILPFSMDTTVYFKTLGTYRCNPGMLMQAPV